MKKLYKAIDCFSGCGGLSEGLKKAGFKVLAGIEINPVAREAHRANHSKTKLYCDIRRVEPTTLLKELKLKKGELDLLAGCPPCQGFSTIRTNNGAAEIKDFRNKLIFDFVRLAVTLKPKTILMENVPGLLVNWRFAEAKRRLRKAGYKWILAEVHDAANFGVPQRRKRMIMLASRLGPMNALCTQNSKVTVRKTIGHLMSPEKTRNRLQKLHMKHSEVVMNRIRRIPKDGGSRSALGSDQLPCHANFHGFRDVYGRMKWDDVAPTITRYCYNPSKGRFLHPSQNRAITMYEAMRLQSFPHTYKFPEHICMTEISSMIGESLPPKFAEAQARHIIQHLKAGPA